MLSIFSSLPGPPPSPNGLLSSPHAAIPRQRHAAKIALLISFVVFMFVVFYWIMILVAAKVGMFLIIYNKYLDK